ncbi:MULTISPECIES: hypothetical protein [unclassified Marinobacter]|uniref:hypothetical protein n=1 Tax=unclassified Marinobacter TaxID=83889 RepID=UPI0019281F6D|nr:MULTISPECIES: hypothetical protein [unclassified Marinobacter]MBL3825139.1 hypothetical protein [Marinobacter sp. MC3]MBL3893657.1 hypothetical protein [Marinobacter sp. MW3]
MQTQTLEHRIPDEILMRRVKMRLRKSAASVSALCAATNRHPKYVRDALEDLMNDGEVREHSDGLRYELVKGGYCPDPEPKGAA